MPSRSLHRKPGPLAAKSSKTSGNGRYTYLGAYVVRHGTRDVARYREQFPDIRLVSVEETFGSWDKVAQEHFGNGGILDRLIAANQ